jgi:hypothetical protein
MPAKSSNIGPPRIVYMRNFIGQTYGYQDAINFLNAERSTHPFLHPQEMDRHLRGVILGIHIFQARYLIYIQHSDFWSVLIHIHSACQGRANANQPTLNEEEANANQPPPNEEQANANCHGSA